MLGQFLGLLYSSKVHEEFPTGPSSFDCFVNFETIIETQGDSSKFTRKYYELFRRELTTIIVTNGGKYRPSPIHFRELEINYDAFYNGTENLSEEKMELLCRAFGFLALQNNEEYYNIDKDWLFIFNTAIPKFREFYPIVQGLQDISNSCDSDYDMDDPEPEVEAVTRRIFNALEILSVDEQVQFWMGVCTYYRNNRLYDIYSMSLIFPGDRWRGEMLLLIRNILDFYDERDLVRCERTLLWLKK
jgi:hypothetical protein